MGVSAGSSMTPVRPAGSVRARSASAGAAAQRASRRTRERTEGRYLESAVRARCADGFEDAAGDEVRHVGALFETGAHFGRGDLGEDGLGTWGLRVTGALDGDDARELGDAREVLPLRALGVQIGAEDQRPLRAGMLPLEVSEEIDGARLAGFLLGPRDAGARQVEGQLLAERDAVVVASLELLAEGMREDRHQHQLVDPLRPPPHSPGPRLARV